MILSPPRIIFHNYGTILPIAQIRIDPPLSWMAQNGSPERGSGISISRRLLRLDIADQP
jgi:hypothetical protein